MHKQLFRSLDGSSNPGEALSPVSELGNRQDSASQRLTHAHRPKDRGRSGTLSNIREKKSEQECSDFKSDEEDPTNDNGGNSSGSNSGSEDEESTQTGGRSVKFGIVETVEYKVNSPIPPTNVESPGVSTGQRRFEELATMSIFSEEDVMSPEPNDGLRNQPQLSPPNKTKSPSSLGSASTTLSRSTDDTDIDDEKGDFEDAAGGGGTSVEPSSSGTLSSEEEESSMEIQSRRRHHSHRKTVSMLGPSVVLSRSADMLIADPSNTRLMDSIGDSQLLDIHGDKRTNVLSYYQAEFKKAKRKGENYSTKHDNELMDQMLRHLTMRVDHDHGPFLESQRTSIHDERTSQGNSLQLPSQDVAHAIQHSHSSNLGVPPKISVAGVNDAQRGKTSLTASDARKATGFGGSNSSSLTATDIVSNGELLKVNTWRVNTTTKETRPVASLEEFRYYRKERDLAIMKYRWLVWFPMVHLMIAAMVQATVRVKSIQGAGYTIILYLLPLSELVDCALVFLLVQVIVLSCGGKQVVAESLDCIIAANNVSYDYINQRTRTGCPIPLIRATSAKRLYNWLIDLVKFISIVLICGAICLPVFDAVRIREDGPINQLDLILKVTLYAWSGLWFILVITVISLVVSISQLLAPLSSLSEKSLRVKTLVVCLFFFSHQIGFMSLLVAELENKRCQHNDDKTAIVMSGSFYLILTYINVICFSVSNIWAFSTADFELWGKSTLARPSIAQLVTHQVDWELFEDDRHFKERNWEFVPPPTLRAFYDKTFGNPAMVRVQNLRQNLKRSDSTRHLILAPSRNGSPRGSNKLLNNHSSSERVSRALDPPKFPTVSSNSDTLIGFDSGSEDQMLMEPNTSRLAPVPGSTKKRMSKEDTLKYMVRINSGNEAADDEDEDEVGLVETSVKIVEEESSEDEFSMSDD